jgi:predicted metal-binding protein
MPTKREMERYVREAVRLGAKEAKAIKTATIVTARWVRMKCQYGCGGFGDRLTCPPYSPTPEQTAAMLREYRLALLVHGDEHEDVTEVAVKLERIIFLDGYYKAFAMGAGPCRLCGECALKSNECRHAYEAKPSMEACGIDVYQTVRNNGYPIEVVKNHNCQENYYGLVLVE